MKRNVVTIARGKYAGMEAQVRAIDPVKNTLEVRVLGGHGVHRINSADLLVAGEQLSEQARQNAERLRLQKRMEKQLRKKRKTGRGGSVWAISAGLPGLGKRS